MSSVLVAPSYGNVPSPAGILFGCIPEAEQLGVLMSLIGSLHTGDHSGIDFVACIVVDHPSSTARQGFLAVLDQALRIGEIQSAVCLSEKYPRLGSDLVGKAIETISKAKSLAEDEQLSSLALQSYLSFIKSTVFRLPIDINRSKLFKECLDLLNAENNQVSIASKDVVFTMLSTTDDATLDGLVVPCRSQIWECIEQLTAPNSKKDESLLGYSLWLRWGLSGGGRYLNGFITDQYWEILLYGLRHGDPEKRKLCLNILKLSVAADSKIVSNTEREQYYRYCTVFETIVLGRYINQIQECRNDLDCLAADSSMPLRWLYTFFGVCFRQTNAGV